MGYNNYGGGMGGRGGQQGGGMEIMVSIACCVCCVCLLCIGLGYWFNVFCGVSKSMGKGCPADEPRVDPTDPPDTGKPVLSVDMCNPSFSGEKRENYDPRPAIAAAACVGQTRVGADCFQWTTGTDALTGLPQWVRVVDEPGKSDRYDATCRTRTVDCDPFIDFAAQDMAGYRSNNSAALKAKCKPRVVGGGATIASLGPIITNAAKTAGAQFNRVPWGLAHSNLWLRVVSPSLEGRVIAAHINNTAAAAIKVRKSLNQNTISNALFAAMMEAAAFPVNNQADWISSVVVNGWAARGLKSKNTEAGLVQYMTAAVGRRLKSWPTIIDNPAQLRG